MGQYLDVLKNQHIPFACKLMVIGLPTNQNAARVEFDLNFHIADVRKFYFSCFSFIKGTLKKKSISSEMSPK